jgi:hypothetical protein
LNWNLLIFRERILDSRVEGGMLSLAAAVTGSGTAISREIATLQLGQPWTRFPGTTDPGLAVFTIYAMFTCP